jgi:hypothetical protein
VAAEELSEGDQQLAKQVAEVVELVVVAERLLWVPLE